MKIQKLLMSFLGLSIFLAQAIKADTMLDGFWQLDTTQSVTCVGKDNISKIDAEAFLKRYGNLSLHLSDLQAVKYLITESGESIASPVFSLIEIKSNQVYLLKHTGTTIADAVLILLDNGDLEYHSKDFEWSLCQGSQYRLIFKYLRLNP